MGKQDKVRRVYTKEFKAEVVPLMESVITTGREERKGAERKMNAREQMAAASRGSGASVRRGRTDRLRY